MRNAPKILLMALAMVTLTATAALAHFQMLYVPTPALDKGQQLEMDIVFTHPFHASHTMNMGKPEAFYLLKKRGEKTQKVDLMGYVKPVEWDNHGGTASAYHATIPAKETRSMGDYMFVMVPDPYYEGEEDIYIQQITKMVVNVAGVPTLWSESADLPTEIMPLDKPYANWEGGVFRGVVMSDGKPVPNAELEIEFANHPPVPGKSMFRKEATIEAPQASYEIMGILTNDRGEFTIGLPKAGWWGICALGSGPDTEHKGKELSQDAVLWVYAAPMN